MADVGIDLIEWTGNTGNPAWLAFVRAARRDGVLNAGEHDTVAFITSYVSTVAMIDEVIPSGMHVVVDDEDDDFDRHVTAVNGEGDIIYLSRRKASERLFIFVHSPSGRDAAVKLRDEIIGKAPPVPKRDDNIVDIGFWTLGEHGPVFRMRHLEAPLWEHVNINYGTDVQQTLEEMSAWKTAPEGGRLVLFHGPPGTGKTNMIRILARSWRDWCKVHYVVDPERFFGEAHYMVEVLLDNQEAPTTVGAEPPPPDPWRLIVVEDAGELLAADAKHRQGQSMSRLLNLCDGLVGQGLKTLTLITTNEDLGELHPAVVRAGRCLADIKMEALTASEADNWRVRNGSQNGVRGTATLAELYEEQRRTQLRSESRRKIGFGP